MCRCLIDLIMSTMPSLALFNKYSHAIKVMNKSVSKILLKSAGIQVLAPISVIKQLFQGL